MADITTMSKDVSAPQAFDASTLVAGPKAVFDGLPAFVQNGLKDAEKFVAGTFGTPSLGDGHAVSDGAGGPHSTTHGGAKIDFPNGRIQVSGVNPESPGLPVKTSDTLPDLRIEGAGRQNGGSDIIARKEPPKVDPRIGQSGLTVNRGHIPDVSGHESYKEPPGFKLDPNILSQRKDQITYGHGQYPVGKPSWAPKAPIES
jgi:hypothetical protein